jgi:hypothetical protein
MYSPEDQRVQQWRARVGGQAPSRSCCTTAVAVKVTDSKTGRKSLCPSYSNHHTFSVSSLAENCDGNVFMNNEQIGSWEEAIIVFRKDASCVRFEVFTTVTMKNADFWCVTPCGSFKNRHFGGSYGLHLQGDMNQRARKNVSRH